MNPSELCRICLEANCYNTISVFLTASAVYRDNISFWNNLVGNQKYEISLAAMGNLTISDMIDTCSPEKTTDDTDGFPNQVCQDCIQHLFSAFSFRLRCEDAYYKFKKLLFGDQCAESSNESALFTIELIDQNDIVKNESDNNDGMKTNYGVGRIEDNALEIDEILVDSEIVDEFQAEHNAEEKQIGDEFQADYDAEDSNGNSTNQLQLANALECSDCKRIFARPSSLKRHRFIHSAQRPYKCDDCGKIFAQAAFLYAHRSEHYAEKLFTCEQCGRNFLRHNNLQKHIYSCPKNKSKKSEEPKGFSCEICSKTFSSSGGLKQHAIVHNRKEFHCKTCNKKFQTHEESIEHTKEHASERTLLCMFCGKLFTCNNNLTKHMMIHTGEKPFKCDLCDRAFGRRFQLDVHKKYHIGNKSYACTMCDKKFCEKKGLTVHMRTHTGERPFKCTYCDKSFCQSNDLRVHIRRHTGERYKCDICNDSFIQNYLLTRHKRKIHGIDLQSPFGRLKPLIPDADTQ